MPELESRISHYLAVDLGASGGRAVLATYADGRVKTEEIHRFKTGFLEKEEGHVYWEITRFWEEIKTSIRKASQRTGGELDSIGIDTWAVDYVLLDKEDRLIGLPYAYRDKRNDGMMERVFGIIPQEELYERTGIQFLPFNTLFQLYAEKLSNDRLPRATSLLFIPDYFNFLLTGKKRSEFTFATTSQFYNPRSRSWDHDLLERVGLPERLLQPIVPAGTVIGGLKPEWCREFGLKNGVKIVAPATHDTGSAVIGSPPDENGKSAYISSGTWSLMGIEILEPLITAGGLKFNFSNEGGFGGSFRYLKNIMGLWLLQRSEEAWEKEGKKISPDQVLQAAREAESFQSMVYPNDGFFLMPPDMPKAIRNFCASTNQAEPRSLGETARCIFLSLAMAYREVRDQIEEVSRTKIEKIHILGGGSQNGYLNQLTADVCGLEVVAGPSEATVLGNLIVQFDALQEVKSLARAKSVFSAVMGCRNYHPEKGRNYDELFRKFLSFKKG
jgi:rhamnulokinase